MQPGAQKGDFESAAEYTGGEALASPGHDATLAGRTARVGAEQPRLKEWARQNGKLGGKLPKEDTRGSEHIVQLGKHAERVVKATRPEMYLGYGIAYGSYVQGATPSEYLDRMAIHNRIFDDDLKLERIVPNRDKLSVVISQPHTVGPDATQSEIDRMMVEEKGFEKLSNGIYYHQGEGLLVHDLVPKNARVLPSGIVHAIDPVIQRVTPEFADYMRKHPPY